MSDYPNSGNLFSDASAKIFRKGKVEVDGVDHNMIIVQHKNTKTGEVWYSSYIEGGKMYVNDNITEDRDYNISGEINIGGQKKMAWGRKREDKNGNDYTRMSFADAKPKEESGISPDSFNNKGQKHDEERQDIPF